MSRKLNPVRNPLRQKCKRNISNRVKITIKNLQKKIPISRKIVEDTIRKVFLGERLEKSGELSVCFVTDARIRRLNKKFLGVNDATDVLAFDMFNRGVLFADIVISTDTLLRNSLIYKTKVALEMRLYIVHGLLHLLGYGDSSAAGKKMMRDKEEKYVNR